MEQTLALASASAGGPSLAGLRLRGFLRRVGRVVVEGRRGWGEAGLAGSGVLKRKGAKARAPVFLFLLSSPLSGGLDFSSLYLFFLHYLLLLLFDILFHKIFL